MTPLYPLPHLTDETQVVGVRQVGIGGPIAQCITKTQRGDVWQNALQCKVKMYGAQGTALFNSYL